MSEPVEKSLPEVEEALAANGENDVVERVVEPIDEQGEESDEYEDVDYEEEKQIVGDEDDEDEEDNEDGHDGEQKSGGLTALLLGDPNVAEEEEEEEEGEDDEYVEEAPVPATPSGGKKRTIDELVEDVDNEASEESEAKKVKA